MAVDFNLTDEQQMLRETARALLTNECPSSLVRAHRDDVTVVEPLWRDHLREWVALGAGTLVDHALFLDEAGTALLPGRYFATSALFLPLLSALGHEMAGAAETGAVTGTVAMAGPAGLWQVNDSAARMFVPEADAVDQIAIVLPGPSVAVCPSAELSMRAVETLDSTRRMFEVSVPNEVLDATPISVEALERVIDRATVAAAAELVGTSRWLVETSVAYSKERVQFDRPIGSFQGLQFKMVDMSLDHERAVAAVYYAAMAYDGAGVSESRLAAHVAKAAAGIAAKHAARDAVQIHGGIGYTWESDVHLYLRRAYAGEYFLGPSTWHHDRLADYLFA